MFIEGIETLLSQEAGIDIVSQSRDLSDPVEYVQKHCPDVVIFNCDDPEIDLTPAILCIFRERLGICVIGLSLQDNQICIYRGEQKQLRQVEDLLDVIKH